MGLGLCKYLPGYRMRRRLTEVEERFFWKKFVSQDQTINGFDRDLETLMKTFSVNPLVSVVCSFEEGTPIGDVYGIPAAFFQEPCAKKYMEGLGHESIKSHTLEVSIKRLKSENPLTHVWSHEAIEDHCSTVYLALLHTLVKKYGSR